MLFLLMFIFRKMLLLGVILGVIFSFRLVFLNDIEVVLEEVVCWYGILVFCLISVLMLLVVIMCGLEMILLWLLVFSVDSFRVRKWLVLVLNRFMVMLVVFILLMLLVGKLSVGLLFYVVFLVIGDIMLV